MDPKTIIGHKFQRVKYLDVTDIVCFASALIEAKSYHKLAKLKKVPKKVLESQFLIHSTLIFLLPPELGADVP